MRDDHLVCSSCALIDSFVRPLTQIYGLLSGCLSCCCVSYMGSITSKLVTRLLVCCCCCSLTPKQQVLPLIMGKEAGKPLSMLCGRYLVTRNNEGDIALITLFVCVCVCVEPFKIDKKTMLSRAPSPQCPHRDCRMHL